MKETNFFTDIMYSRILNIIWKKRSISRIEIANALEIDKSTVTKNVSVLKKTGIIHEYAQGETGPLGGRKPIFLEINASFACVGGIEINSERLICTLLDLHGEIIFQFQKNISPKTFNKLGCKDIFSEAHAMIVLEAKKRSVPVIAIGVGLPGLINAETGTIIQSKALYIQDAYDFKKDIQTLSSIPILIENDARCCCYSEKVINRDKIIKDTLFLLVEYRLTQPTREAKRSLAIGIGLILDGKIFKGWESLAGEFRSILWQKGIEGQFHAHVASGDLNAYKSICPELAYKELAQHIAFLVTILNLQTVFVGGPGSDSQSQQQIQKQINEQIQYTNPYNIPRNCNVVTDSLGSLSVAYGAGAMCLDTIFDHDAHQLRGDIQNLL